MKLHGTLFQGSMVRSIQEDRKSQTRRMHGLEEVNKEPDAYRFGGMHKAPSLRDGVFAIFVKGDSELLISPKYQPGDQLWVRESIRAEELPSGLDGVRYLADGAFVAIENTREAGDRWMRLRDYAGKRYATIPSIHMPRWASRITLEVTEVRCQRVQDISEDDAWAEGFPNPEGANRDYPDRARYWFQTIWQSINGNWDANPYVFAYTFRKI